MHRCISSFQWCFFVFSFVSDSLPTSQELFLFYTDDHSRVVLTPIEGEPGSDYINATRVDVSETLPMTTYASKT